MGTRVRANRSQRNPWKPLEYIIGLRSRKSIIGVIQLKFWCVLEMTSSHEMGGGNLGWRDGGLVGNQRRRGPFPCDMGMPPLRIPPNEGFLMGSQTETTQFKVPLFGAWRKRTVGLTDSCARNSKSSWRSRDIRSEDGRNFLKTPKTVASL